MANSIQKEVEALTEACEKMANAKLALVDKNISNILTTIAKTEHVYGIIATSMINFNFSAELKRATSEKGLFVLPPEAFLRVALGFALLQAIEKKNIDIIPLLDECFKAEDREISFQKFMHAVVLPWCDTISMALKVEYPEGFLEEKRKPFDKNIMNRIQFLLQEIEGLVMQLPKRKVDALFATRILTAIKQSLMYNDISLVKTLYETFVYIFGEHKALAEKLSSLENVINALEE